MYEGLAIGGVGGSGTRALSWIAQEDGRNFGADQNPPGDLLWATFLLKDTSLLTAGPDALAARYRLLRAALAGGAAMDDTDRRVLEGISCAPRGPHPADWLAERRSRLTAALSQPRPAGPWGWKEPNTHIFAAGLLQIDPTLRFVYMQRDGRDMALSRNQNQLRFWGPHVLGARATDDAAGSLRFWCWAQARQAALAARFPDRVLTVRFEDLCADPETQISRLLRFAGRADADARARDLAALVTPPADAGRGRGMGLEQQLSAEERAVLSAAGYGD